MGDEEEFPRTCSHLPSKVHGYQYFLILPHWETVEALRVARDTGELPANFSPKILMFRDAISGSSNFGGSWHLPAIEFSKQPYYRVPAIIKAAQEKWGLKILLSLNVEEAYDSDLDMIQLVYLADVDWGESKESFRLPRFAEWADSSILEEPTKYQKIRTFAEQYFQEIQTQQLPQLRVPWALSGWYSETLSWISSELGKLGITIEGPVEQIDLSCLSLVSRVKTNLGHIYFKASAPAALPHESALTSYLHEQFPGKVPAALTFDPKYGLLMHEFKGRHIGSFEGSDSYDIWARAITVYADLQLDCINKTEEIEKLDCSNRDIPHLLQMAKSILLKPTMLKAGNTALTDSDIQELLALMPRIEDMGNRLQAYKIPYTIDHGDLYPSNIIQESDGTIMIFDWAEASITHPFFSLLPFLRDLPDSLADKKEDILEAYLNKWTKFEPMERLKEAWELASYLGMLLQGVKFWEITNKIEPNCRHYDQPSIPLWFGFLLKKLKNERALGWV